MRVKWTMNIGYAGANQTGEVEIDEEAFEGKTEEEIEEIINQEVWEDAVQYVDTAWKVVKD